MALFAELRRRNVLKVALLYAVACWLILWFVDVVQAEVSVPAWTDVFTYFVLVVGYPVALWFAWTYEITPGGLKKAADVDQTQSVVYKTGQKLNSAVAVLLVISVKKVTERQTMAIMIRTGTLARPVNDEAITSSKPD